MSKSYKFALSFICVLIIGCLSLGVYSFFYESDNTESSTVLVDGHLSINFLNGNILKDREEKEYKLNFSVTNNSKDVASYSINLIDVKASDDVLIKIINNVSNAIIYENNLPDEDQKIVNDIQIASGETHNYSVIVNGKNTPYQATLKIIEEKPNIVTFAQTILKNNAVSNTTLTKVGEELAIDDEGLISDIDDSGSTYYFRGATQNNYVEFAGLLWRIVRINGDGTVKLILNNSIDTVQAYYNKTDGEYYTYNESNIKNYLTSWYEHNLLSEDDYISLDKYCNDYNTTNETDKIFSSFVRNITNKIPTFNCLGKNVGVKIGLLTADEAIYAGAIYEKENTNYYLYNKDITDAWWTMTPAKMTDSSMSPFVVTSTGELNSNINGNLNRRVRPVISLIKEISVSGKGTAENPYTIDK